MAPSPDMPAKCFAEFLGTFLLVFTVGCNVMSGNSVWGGVSIAAVLMVSIYALGNISGANFNPAVSLALGLTKAMNGPGLEWKQVGIYACVQIVGAMCAGCAYSSLFFDNFNLQPSPGFNGMQACLCEFLFTLMLCFVVLNVAVAEKSGNAPNQFYGLAIGFVIVAGAYGAGAVSGGCFNPAVAIGIDSVSVFKGFGWCILYTVSELCGAALAAFLFKIVRPQEFDEEKGPMADILSEFLGTFFLVLTVGLNVLAKSPAGAFSIAASLMSMIYALGNVSGAHFNPAVTAAILVSDRCKDLTSLKAGKFVIAQVAGGVTGALIYKLIRNGDSFPLQPGTGFGWPQVGLAEIMFTFVLCYAVLCVAVSPKTKSPIMFGLVIGSCVTVGGNAIGAISGGSLNPAVSFGISAAHLSAGGDIAGALAYTLFEVIGACMAAVVFNLTHAVDTTKEVDDEKVLA